jgi:hypothetical protein
MVSDLATSSPLIEDIHSVKVWQLTPDQLRLTLHARVRDGGAMKDALEALKARLEERYGIRESTIQIECGGCPDETSSVVRPSAFHGNGNGHDHHHGHAPFHKGYEKALSGSDAAIDKAARAVANLRAMIK